MKYVITERHNPQLGVYYINEGQMTNREAARKPRPIYGSEIKLVFNCEAEYMAKLDALSSAGQKVQ